MSRFRFLIFAIVLGGLLGVQCPQCPGMPDLGLKNILEGKRGCSNNSDCGDGEYCSDYTCYSFSAGGQ